MLQLQQFHNRKYDLIRCFTFSLPDRKTEGTVKKSTRVSIVTKNINLSSAAKKRIKKYTTKKTAKAKSICKGNGLFVLSYYTHCIIRWDKNGK